MNGLSTSEAAQRLTTDGPNALPNDARNTWLMTLWDAMREPMFALMLGAGLLYVVLGDLQEGLILLGLVLVVVALTLYQEGKTAHALQALRDMSSPRALVLRDGQPTRIAGSEVVVGDVLIVAEGDRVAADAVLLSGNDVTVDESLLSGESAPVHKIPVEPSSMQSAPEHPGGDQLPWLYSGTLLVQGHGQARVTATGARSQIGRIGAALTSVEVQATPLKKQTAQLVKVLAIVAGVASLLLIIAFGLLRGDWLGAVLAGIALAMALLPQEFTVVLTVLPALGAWRLSKQNVLTRRMTAIETLGATSVLCVDKTGTLTENRMTVAQLAVRVGSDTHTLKVDYTASVALPEAFHTLVEFSILASVAEPFDPMEKAFHRLGQHFLEGTEHLHRDWTLLQSYGLTPQLRAMSQVWEARQGTTHVVAAKGAPEAIIDLCHLDAAATVQIERDVQAMAALGLRVLGVAQAQFVGEAWPEGEHDFDFTYVGLLGLADPLRPGIASAMQECHAAGIRVMMITGDYPATASAIALQAGLSGTKVPEVLGGDTMATLSDAALQTRLRTTDVCARVAPAQKLRIVQALQANGDVVAMTGDGVNDAPALKAAHVGVAMGGRGTDVAREAAAMVLMDDNFTSIVRAVQLGRRIFDNLRKSMFYILAVHVPIAGLALLPVLMGWPVMLFPLHIAFLELVIDPSCSMVFENEPLEAGAMQRPPRDPNARLVGGRTLMIALLQGAGALTCVVAAYLWGSTWLDERGTRAFVFITLVLCNLLLLLSSRTGAQTLWQSLAVPNRTLWLVISLTTAVLALTLYVPWLAGLFQFSPLAPLDWLRAVVLGAASLVWFRLVR
jgi:P-type Ca2+ transporter type 2C